jgi:hypothetical protein
MHCRRYVGIALVSVLLVTLPGCGPKRMRADFVGFESAYAETSNREVLMNLARLQNHDPTYFFKIGQISSSYRMQASITGNGSYAVQTTNPLVGGPTGGGSPLLNYENNPAFTFIPVNDQTNAQYLLQPIPAETFDALYQQGWRVDQLFRLMVDRIELTSTKSPGVCDVETFRNVPPQGYGNEGGSKGPDYDHDPGAQDTLSRYAVFLRISAVLYALQKHGDLLLAGTNTFVPFDDKSGLRDDADVGSSAGAGAKSRAPSAIDVVNAADKGSVWEQKDGEWLLGQKVTNAVFYLNHYRNPTADPAATSALAQMPKPCDLGGEASSDKSDTCRIAHDILQDPDMRALKEVNDARMLMRVLRILSNGFSITGPQSSHNSNIGPCPPKGVPGISSHLVLRSLVGIMAAAAQEQAPFDALLQENPPVPPSAILDDDKDPSGTAAPQVRFKEDIPPVEQLPLLELTGERAEQITAPLIQLSYRGMLYRVADLKVPNSDAPENRYWNRDVFRLVNQLTSQVTVDISKFPLPTILQLNTQ